MIYWNKLILVLILLICNTYSFCDVILTPTHYVRNCIKIVNIDDYPDICFLACITSDWPVCDKVYEIKSNRCIKKCGYCNFSVYAVRRNYIEGKDIKKMNWSRNNNALKSNYVIEPFSSYLEDTSPISSVTQYYKIAGFTNSSVEVYKWKEVFKFNTVREDSVANYSYSGDISILRQDF